MIETLRGALAGAAASLPLPGEVLAPLLIALLLLVLAIQAATWVRARRRNATLAARLAELEHSGLRSETLLRDELARSRQEANAGGRELRTELAGSIKNLTDSLLESGHAHAGEQRQLLDSVAAELRATSDRGERHLGELREVLDGRLEAMRATVDEKLQGSLEKRLGEAFAQVSERLEAVHKGLGEMQSLASGVGDLKKMLGNVKTRGTWGEVQLADLLEQVFTPDQYERNVCIKRGSAERVDFVLKLPGPDEHDPQGVWLPIDAKFPLEDYHRLLDASDAGEAEAAAQARRALEQRVLGEARSLRDKYLSPPRTTDFGILFVPSEGLYAEVLRTPGIIERLQRESRVVVAGPTTLAAMLNSLQMGFRTLAIQKRSSEVWKLLAAVKKQLGQFGGLLEKVQRNLEQASTSLEHASKQSRTIERRLERVEALPSGEAEP